MKAPISKRAELFYRLMLRLYPKDFRSQYGDQMQLDFRDLYENSSQSKLRFWMELLSDFATSLLTQHAKQSIMPMKPTHVFVFSMFLSGLVFALGIKTLPRVYTSDALVEVALHSERGGPRVMAIDRWLPDVTEELDLKNRWNDFTQSPPSTQQVVARLREKVTISPVRLTSCVRISVLEEDPALGAEIANVFARKMTEDQDTGSHSSIVQMAAIPVSPSSPNLPQWTLFGILICFLMSASLARAVRRLQLA